MLISLNRESELYNVGRKRFVLYITEDKIYTFEHKDSGVCLLEVKGEQHFIWDDAKDFYKYCDDLKTAMMKRDFADIAVDIIYSEPAQLTGVSVLMEKMLGAHSLQMSFLENLIESFAKEYLQKKQRTSVICQVGSKTYAVENYAGTGIKIRQVSGQKHDISIGIEELVSSRENARCVEPDIKSPEAAMMKEFVNDLHLQLKSQHSKELRDRKRLLCEKLLMEPDTSETRLLVELVRGLVLTYSKDKEIYTRSKSELLKEAEVLLSGNAYYELYKQQMRMFTKYMGKYGHLFEGFSNAEIGEFVEHRLLYAAELSNKQFFDQMLSAIEEKDSVQSLRKDLTQCLRRYFEKKML